MKIKSALFSRPTWYYLGIFAILFVAIILRFYDYENRWGLAYDQAHGAIIARYALENAKLPLLGPFSSAGPFQTGGEWYWFIIIGTALFPSAVLSPWIFLTVVSVFFVLLIIFLGSELINRNFGLLAGLIAAFSPGEIKQSFNLTNQSPLAIVALLAIYSMIRYVRTKKSMYLFFLGFFCSLAATIHLQGFSLLFLVFFTLIFTGFPSRKSFGALLLGMLLPILPILIFDMQNDFVNSRNMLYYYLHDQYNVSLEVLGRRWLTYLGEFWPTTWANIIGGYTVVSTLLIGGVGYLSVYSLFKKKISREWLVLLLSMLGSIVMLRYLRTPLFESYVVFMHPYIILATTWLLFVLMKKKLIGFAILFIVIGSTLYANLPSILNSENSTAFRVREWVKLLQEKYPNKKFAIYDYTYRNSTYSFPLVLHLQALSLLDDDGYRIGFGSQPKVIVQDYPEIPGNTGGFVIRDLESTSRKVLEERDWSFINPSEVYRATEEWR